MLVFPSRQVTQGAVVTGLLALSACTDPTLRTDLRPDGPPDILAVLVMNDASDGLLEAATFCKLNDDKRPTLVVGPPGAGTPLLQICPQDPSAGAEMVTDAVPSSWYVRFMFDELLNPSVEDLVDDPSGDGTFTGTLVNTQPATLQCDGVDVPYDGFYNSAGNSQTWALGPSLRINPTDPDAVPSGATCTVGLKPDKVFDKQGIGVPTNQLADPGYTFKIADLTLTATDPAAPAALTDPTKIDEISVTAPLAITFNAAIDAASLSPSEVTILEVTACTATVGVPVVAKIAANAKDKFSIDISDSTATSTDGKAVWNAGKTYLITFAADAEVSDRGGATFALADAGDDLKKPICFTTPAATP